MQSVISVISEDSLRFSQHYTRKPMRVT